MKKKVVNILLFSIILVLVPFTGCDFETISDESGALMKYDSGPVIVEQGVGYIVSSCTLEQNFKTILSFDTSAIPEENSINQAAIFLKIQCNNQIPDEQEMNFLRSNLRIDMAPATGFANSFDLEYDDFDAPPDQYVIGRTTLPVTFYANNITVIEETADPALMIAINFPERAPGEVHNPMDSIHKGGKTQVRLYFNYCFNTTMKFKIVDAWGSLGVDAY